MALPQVEARRSLPPDFDPGHWPLQASFGHGPSLCLANGCRGFAVGQILASFVQRGGRLEVKRRRRWLWGCM